MRLCVSGHFISLSYVSTDFVLCGFLKHKQVRGFLVSGDRVGIGTEHIAPLGTYAIQDLHAGSLRPVDRGSCRHGVDLYLECGH